MMAFRAAQIRPSASRLVSHLPSTRSPRFGTNPFHGSNSTFSQFGVMLSKYSYQHNYRKFSTAGDPGSSSPSTESAALARVLSPESQKWIIRRIGLFPFSKLILGFGLFLCFSAGDVLYAYYRNRLREKDLRSAFDKGTVPEVSRAGDVVERKGITEVISSILQPPPGHSLYNMIIGNHGTGKTTLIRHIGHQLEGIVYLDIQSPDITKEIFGDEFARTLRWSPPMTTWLTVLLGKLGIVDVAKPSDKRPLFNQVLDEFHNQARIFGEENDRCPVLVIDNINCIASADPKLLEVLQDMAKRAADEKLFTTVFVTSEGQAPIRMLARSAVSRMGLVLEVGELTRDEAVHLCNNRGQSSEDAAAIYDLVGGRASLIMRVIDDLGRGLDFSEIKAHLMTDEKVKFRDAKMLVEEGDVIEQRLRIASHILKNGRIRDKDFFRIAGTADFGKELLAMNIFRTIPRAEWITFQSKLTETFARGIVQDFEMEAKAEAEMEAKPKSRSWWFN